MSKYNKEVHPVCQFSPNPGKCQQFVDRLETAHDNIDVRDDSELRETSRRKQKKS